MAKTHRVDPTVFQYTYGPNKPQVRVSSGDTVVAVTRDAGGLDVDGKPMPKALKPSRDDTRFQESNPCVGPVYVEDAEPGDVLQIEIRRIALNRDWAWSRIIPNFGSFTGEGPGYEFLFNTPLRKREYRWELDLKRNTGTLKLEKSRLDSATIPLHPFIGSIGVAPSQARVENTLTPGEYGGNMDCVDTRQGATLLLPVWVRGGYVAFGDIHAAQGDGEVCGVALETTAEVTLRLTVLKGPSIQWPRILDRTHLMVAASGRPLYEAAALSHVEMVNWLSTEYGFDKWEALQLLSQVGTMRVGNVVDPRYTVVAKFPRKYLPQG